MEGHVNPGGGGEPGNQFRRRPTAPQARSRGRGFASSPQGQLPGGREVLQPGSLGRKPMPSRPAPRTAAEVAYAHQNDVHGHDLRYGNTHDEAHARPHYSANPNSTNPNSANPNSQYQYATADPYRQGHGMAHPQAAAYYDNGPQNGDAETHGQPNVKGRGYEVEEQEAMGQENQPNEKCMRCVHGIAVPIARLSTRAVFKGTRCVACLCTIL